MVMGCGNFPRHDNPGPNFTPLGALNVQPSFGVFNCSMLKNIRNPSLQLRSKNFQLSIRINSIRSFTMAPLKSWLPIPADSHFSLANIPFGIITSKNSQVEKRPAVAIGDHVLDLKAFAAENGFSGLHTLKDHLTVFAQPTLNAFAALGQPTHREVRKYLQDVFSESTSHPQILKDNAALQQAALLPKHETKTHLPMQIGDYTDFFASINHAFNVGTMFRARLLLFLLRLFPHPLANIPPPRGPQTPSNQTTPISQSATTAAPPPS